MFEDFCVVFGNNHSRVDACPMLLHASFKLGGKKARDLDLTRRCHLGITIPDSMFYSSMDCGITWGVAVFFNIEEIQSALLLLEY